MVTTFAKLVKEILQNLPSHDYPVLNSRLFFQTWLELVMDKSITSLRDGFKRLNHTGIEFDISTFSKANRLRSLQPFMHAYQALMKRVRQGKVAQSYQLCPLDSTVITLTSKLFWLQQYHQVKLFTCWNETNGSTSSCVINFNGNHDSQFAEVMMTVIPQNGIGIFDRGFASIDFIDQLCQTDTLFVLRLNQNYRLQLDEETGKMWVGSKQPILCRVVCFCDLETKTEYRLATNLSEAEFSGEEIGEIYRHRWGIELLWKFLKMHLKLDRLLTKNVNGVTIQIYMVLIVYLILQLIEIPTQWGSKLLDKLRYLQCCMCQQTSYVHWTSRILAGLGI